MSITEKKLRVVYYPPVPAAMLVMWPDGEEKFISDKGLGNFFEMIGVVAALASVGRVAAMGWEGMIFVLHMR